MSMQIDETKTQAISKMLDMGWWEIEWEKELFCCSPEVARLLEIQTTELDANIFFSLIREDYRARVIHTIQSAPEKKISQLVFPTYINNRITWINVRFRRVSGQSVVAGMMHAFERLEEELHSGKAANETLRNFIYQLNGVSRSLLSFLQSENLDDTVNHILASLVKHFGAERSYIFAYDWEAGDQSCLYESVSREGLEEIQNLQQIPLEINPWWSKQMRELKPIILSTLYEMPPEDCNLEMEYLSAQSIQSLMVVPFVNHDNEVWGYAGIDLVDHQRDWTREDYEWFSSLMHIINICIELGKSKTQIQADKKELEESGKLLRSIYENLPVGIELHDKEGLLLYANDKDIEIFELDNLEDRKGLNVFDHPGLPSEVKRKMKNGETADFNILYDFGKAKNYYGKTFPHLEPKNLIVKIIPIFDQEQEIQNYLFIVIDNTETTNAYLKIQEFENYFLLIANLAKVGYFKWDISANEGFAIDQWFINLGKPSDSVMTGDPENIYENLSPDDRKDVIDFYRKAAAGKAQSFEREVRVIDADEHTKWMRCTITARKNVENNHTELIGISFDITELKEMILAKNKAETLDRLKSAFLANMSHEVRTPLNSIIGFSDLLAETDDADEQKEYIAIIQRNNDLLLKLVTDILDLSKIESGTLNIEKTEIQAKSLCEEVLQSFRNRQISDDVHLLFDNTLPDEAFYGDPNRIKQVFFNLITNSIKFTSRGYIKLGYQSLPHGDIRFYVEDTGTGISPEHLDQVFDRFAKFDHFAQGAGLGLPICKSLIEEMGGVIGAESVFGQGSCFWFTLPKYEPQPTA